MNDTFKKKIDSAFTSAASETGTSPSEMGSESFKLQGELKNGETKEATGAGAAGGYSGPLGGETKEEKIKGGLSSGKSLTDIAKKHKIDIESLKTQLSKGIKVEMEHTDNKQTAKEIAMDHLYEDPKYYTKLKKIEATEATGASSAGQYSGPAFLAKSTSKKDWRGASKTQIPGGKFVQVKKKCKTFPYCNQGDIKALKIFENETLKRVIKIISEKHNISEIVIKNIIIEELNKKKKTNK